MILGIGIDLIETARIHDDLQRFGTRFESRVYTERELESCADRADRVQALAARFAAKEACLKALGTGWSGGLGFSQIEVVSAPKQPPRLKLHGPAAQRAAEMGATRFHLSMTHERHTAAAVVVLEGDGVLPDGASPRSQ